MTPAQLRTFLAVADTLSLRAAAKRLGVTQPAVTKSIRELERQMDVPLVLRHGKGVTLTECGSAFRHHATCLMEEMRRTRENLLAISSNTTPSINVAVSSSMAFAVLPPVLHDFRAVAPRTEIHLIDATMPDGLAMLLNGSVDMLLVHTLKEWIGGDVDCVPIFSCPMTVCAAKTSPYLAANSIGQLLNANWIYPNDPFNSIESIFTSNGFESPKVSVRSQSFVGTQSLLRLPDYIAVTLDIVVKPLMNPIGIEKIRVREKFPFATGMVITRKGIAPTKALSIFLECLLRYKSKITAEYEFAKRW